jgi:ribosomal protein S12 methylthiotransferase accessory factor
MEAIEQWHAENPAVDFTKNTFAALEGQGREVVVPDAIEGYYRGVNARKERFDWIEGENLITGAPAWLPAFAAYYYDRQQQPLSYNGLASGNHIVEASLHAIYELIERASLAGLSQGAYADFSPCNVIDVDTIDDASIASLHERILRAGLEVVLLRVPSNSAALTFMAILIDPAPFANVSRVNVGSGTHLSPAVAAIRAITEAAQSRLTFIHGSREDLTEDAYRSPHDVAYSYFCDLEPDTTWNDLEDRSSEDMLADYERLIAEFRRGRQSIYRVNLSRDIAGISVVKIVMPGVRRPPWL